MVELLTSGTIVFLEPKIIDVFCVGGGGAGRSEPSTFGFEGYGGGGGGYTRTVKNMAVNANMEIPVTIGAGGNYETTSGSGKGGPGGATSFNAISVNGGKASSGYNGGSGGSGGGAGVNENSGYGTGGSDGGSGERGDTTTKAGGVGQGTTTREFGERTGKLYAGGGGGGRCMDAQSPVISEGGTGGGGSGSWVNKSGTKKQVATAGEANTGGGGGGGAVSYTGMVISINGASGGSGIVCFRNAAPLPELAGTWVLNERLYAPENDIYENISFTASTPTSPPDKRTCTAVSVKEQYVSIKPNTANWITGYNILANKWINRFQTWTFPTGATASVEFRAWLASNATKQTA